MGGVLRGSRLPVVTIVLSIVVTAIFHALYQDVAITSGLQLEFVLAAFLCALASEGLIRVVGRPRTPASPALPPEPAPDNLKERP